MCSRCQSILEPCIKNWSELIDYIESDIGTVTIAALVIKEAKNKLQNYVEGYSNAQKEAVYITYYKQGPLFVSRYLERVKKEKTNGINPGEGCRVYFQRKRFLQILGLSE